MRKLSEIELPKTFEPDVIEKNLYEFWQAGGFFKAQDTSDKPPYCIVIPPPNVTGALHMGHALTVTIQDMLIRWRRMQGYNTLWMPGCDHAGIATQMVVERQLRNEGTSRHDLGRDKFVERVWQWKEQYGNRITEQLKRMGVSLDWDRERFTMDEGLSEAVRHAFVSLYKTGEITRDNRLINWCSSCRTALSDVEVDRDEPEAAEMWSFAYEIVDGGEIIVATTRPETMLGDTAVVVHPDDDRYKDLIGKMVKHPFQDRTFPIVADALLADPELGTGAVKVTPAHDPNDFECGRRNNLDFIDIFNDDATVNENGAPFTGLDRFEARSKVKAAIREKGLERGSNPHEYAPGRCQRCRTVVEPKLSLQWFVDTGKMAQDAMDAVRNKDTEFVPKHQEHRYFDWLEPKMPWCISRQLWWGHRIPAWYCNDCNAITVSEQEAAACEKCGSKNIHQDEDVLDTWFSSALWPFSTLGWPKQTDALKTFYPTSVLETGYDIITFWVSRMMMMGIRFMGDVPFKHVLLHPMVRDQDGNKMSKSKGNVIDPLDVVEGISLDDMMEKTRGLTLPEAEINSAIEYQKAHFPNGFAKSGTDALRYTLAAYTGQDQDIRFSVDRVESNRKFCNKIWQATLGFSLPNLQGMTATSEVPKPITLADRWILARLHKVISDVNKGLEDFKVGEVTQLLYHFFWDELCSWYIELQKPVFMGDDAEKRADAQRVLRHTLDVSLRLLHPLMPFVTEILWQQLPKTDDAPDSIMTSSFPTNKDGVKDDAAIMEATKLMEIVTAVRAIRAEYNVAPSKPISLELRTDDETVQAVMAQNSHLLKNLAKIEDYNVGSADAEVPSGCATAVAAGAQILVPLKEIIDLDAEKARLEKEKDKCQKEIDRSDKKLSNEKFVANAPEAVIQKEKAKATENKERMNTILEALKRLEEM
ncbi:MAG: valine--tRNA ligase [Deltaproteobacteria bacterium]|nr:valine--tRNA ligase [Deltaproteobacteria bacterium]MBN2673602.1 valine--tRNA ligase [Deltaproteobacteria bacterium]